METFPLRKEDDRLLSEEILTQKITALNTTHHGKPILLVYHYPHNPTGKTLSETDAQKVGATLNALSKKFPNLYLVQEDLYLTTTAPELGIYTPLQHLDDNAKQHAIWLHSPSKMGHPRDRGAVVGAYNPDLLKHLRGAVSADSLGSPSPGLLATANTLLHIAQGGVDAVTAPGSKATNHRFETARYYQERLRAVHTPLAELQKKLHTEIVEPTPPQGAYYLYPNFDVLRFKPIPKELLPIFKGKTTFETADDITLALENAHLMGLRPVTTASGTLFERNPKTMSLRISTVEPEIAKLQDAANSITGLMQKTLGQDLGANFKPMHGLQDSPARSGLDRLRRPLRWDRGPEGGRQWTPNIR